MSSLRYYTRLSMIEQVNNLILSSLLCCRSTQDQTAEEYVFKCRRFSAVALAKIKIWLLLYCHLAKDQVKNTA
jgi:hypothetical protein